MNAFEIAFWVVTTILGAGGLVFAIHLYRVERDAPSQTERLLGGGHR